MQPRKTAEDTIEWYGELSGQPVALNALSEQQRQEIRDALDDDLKILKSKRHYLLHSNALPMKSAICLIPPQPYPMQRASISLMENPLLLGGLVPHL